MSLLTDIQEEPSGRFPIRCPIALLVSDKPELGQEVIEAIDACDDAGIYRVTAVSIANYLRKSDIIIVPDAIRRHRRGACACEWRTSNS